MIKCSLTEFGGASAENIWLGVMKKRPLCVRSVAGMIPSQVFFRPALPLDQQVHSISVLYVTLLSLVMQLNMKNENCCSFFNRKCQALVFTPLKGLIFITRSILSFFFNAKLSLRDNGLIVFVNFSFSSGCDLHDWRQNYLKKTKWLYFGLARHTFITNDGYKIIEIVRTLS